MDYDLKKMCGWIKKKAKRIWCKELKTSIYYMDVGDLPNNETYLWLSVERRRKFNKYYKDCDRKLLVGSEMIFFYGLCYENNLEINIFNLKNICNTIRMVTRYGKPYLKDYNDLFFNISHSGKYAVCAFSDTPVGVDVEYVDKVLFPVAKKYYTNEEYYKLINSAFEIQNKIFYEYWVLKESYTKARGLGLRIKLDSFSFENRNNSFECRKVINVDNADLYVAKIIEEFDGNYKLGICKKISTVNN